MLEWLNGWLSSPWLPLILYLGAFSDAFIFTALFVLGEVFFVAAGYAFANQQSPQSIAAIWLGAVSGDVLSYVLGRHYGMTLLYKWVKKRPKLRLNSQRAKSFIRQKGMPALILARIIGPISKITPFLAGSLKMPVVPFLTASILGVVIGTAQFVFAGWLLAKGMNNTELTNTIWHYVRQNPLLVALIAGLPLLMVGLYIKHKKAK
ncbi:DedA family protein [Pasteurellaceae bacterium LIM206]|nr:DedA family protein [Pasteurellaceae bacterium LIM206]